MYVCNDKKIPYGPLYTGICFLLCKSWRTNSDPMWTANILKTLSLHHSCYF